MATPTPRGLHRLDTIDPYRLVNDWNQAENATDAALTAVEDGAAAYADLVGQEARAHADTAVAALGDRTLPAADVVQSHLHLSVNLANPEEFTPDIMVDHIAGGEWEYPGLTATGHIPVTPGTVYSMSMVRQMAWFKADGSPLRADGVKLDSPAPWTGAAPAKAASVRVTVPDEFAPTLQVEAAPAPTAFEPYGLTIPDLRMDGFVKPTKNLANPKEFTSGIYVDYITGREMKYDGFTATGHISVTPGTVYSISVVRQLAWFKADGSSLGVEGFKLDPITPLTVEAPPGAASVRVSVPDALAATLQVEKGPAPTAFVPYGFTIPGLHVETETPPAPNPSASHLPLTVDLDGDTLVVSRDLGGQPLAHTLRLTDPRGRNGVVNYGPTTLAGDSLWGDSDEVAPVRTQLGLVGANHGYAPGLYRFTNPDGKGRGDLGSIWDSGGRRMAMVAVNSTTVMLMAQPITNGDGLTVADTVPPAAQLTHVSGATNTAPIDHTTRVATQLLPSISRHSVRVLADGAPITQGTGRECSQVQVVEVYDVMDYGDLWAQVTANVGTYHYDLPVAPALGVRHTITVDARGIIEDYDFTEHAPTRIEKCGALHATSVYREGGQTIRHMPGIQSIDGIDWGGEGVDLEAVAVNQVFKSEHLTAPGVPPMLTLDRLRVNGATVAGVAVGYRSHQSAATDPETRIERQPDYLWETFTHGKSFPRGLAAEPGWGRLHVRGFRAFLTAEDADALATTSQRGAWAAQDHLAQITGMEL